MNKPNRIEIVDVLRGFALLLIVLIHFVEHFNFFKAPEINFFFSQETDNKVLGIVFLLISGKAYSIFALLFGYSFYIQLSRRAREGSDFRLRFLWRMTLLFIIGFIHSLFYGGDILHIYAMLSVPLVLLCRQKTKTLVVVTIILLIQVPFIYHLFRSFSTNNYVIVERIPQYWEEGFKIYANGSLLDVIKYNFWKGRISGWNWTIYNGRYLQLTGLFFAGYIIGRKQFFEQITHHKKQLVYASIISVVSIFFIVFLNKVAVSKEFSQVQSHIIKSLLESYSKLLATVLILSLIILLYLRNSKGWFYRVLATYGRMSLSNYVFQAVFGVVFFYGCFMGMYRYLGSTWSLILGFLFFMLQAGISYYWLKKYYYGPIEWLWKALTYWDFTIKFKK